MIHIFVTTCRAEGDALIPRHCSLPRWARHQDKMNRSNNLCPLPFDGGGSGWDCFEGWKPHISPPPVSSPTRGEDLKKGVPQTLSILHLASMPIRGRQNEAKGANNHPKERGMTRAIAGLLWLAKVPPMTDLFGAFFRLPPRCIGLSWIAERQNGQEMQGLRNA
jgi:hypothetical protein